MFATGPVTAEGKAKSSQNARRHGLTAKQLIVKPEEQEDFDALESDLRAEAKPRGAHEETVFAQVVHAAWNLRRIREIEAEKYGDPNFLLDPDLSRSFKTLMLYRQRTERTYHQSLKELRLAQTNRMRLYGLDREVQRHTPIFADLEKLTANKRSGEIDPEKEIALMERHIAGIDSVLGMLNRHREAR